MENLMIVDSETETALSVPEQQKAALVNAASLAQDVAKIVRDNGLSKSFKAGAKEHVFVEGWLTISRVNNEAPHSKIEAVESVLNKRTNEEHEVVKARAWITDAHGAVVSEADGYCSDEEPNWRGKPFYARASMAQTRAIGKAMRLRHAWVMVMAGFSPTPAEEMDGVLDEPKPTPAKVVKKAPVREQAEVQSTAPADGSPEPIITVDTSGMELVAVKGFNPNPKPTTMGGFSYGVVLETAGAEAEQWFTTFSKTCYENAKLLKGKNAYAKFEKKGQYTNLMELVSADA